MLTEILADDNREIDHNQFNELLLLVNKNRIGKPMFNRFFGEKCRVGDLGTATERFQAVAMLRYGNFVFAYRALSQIADDAELAKELGRLFIDGDSSGAEFLARGTKLLEIKNIPKEDTSLVGYLSATQIVADAGRSKLLRMAVKKSAREATWIEFEDIVKDLTKPEEQRPVLGIVGNYRQRYAAATPDDFGDYLSKVGPEIDRRHSRLLEVQALASQNQDIYLTWDHMDVYFATSMRKAWEFTDLYSFVSSVIDSPNIRELAVRYFDPTQSYTGNRIDKGIVESLMLKRAKCTVYSVQDTDTLGKDSELAATLAQGKPVIAYVPSILEPERRAELLREEPQVVLERLRFVLNADDRFTTDLSDDQRSLVADFRALPEFAQRTIFRSVPDENAVEEFRSSHRAEMERLCSLIATSEKRIYDSRANTLKKLHPLGIQVNLGTGVANGVMVVRSVAECSSLLRRVLTDTMEFDVVEDTAMWSLRERISESIFRVVTKNTKISNCFWNFYLRG